MRIYQRHLVAVFCVSLLAMIGAETAMAQTPLHMYGYFSTRFEKTYETYGPNGVIDEASPSDFAYPYFNLMGQYSINDQFRAFLNINGAKASTLDLRNFWGEYSASRNLNLRIGKIYRKFGLYNEILDAVPTYYGIEAPELFDADHLMISRTTMAMVYGAADLGPGVFSYSGSTDNGEGDPLNAPSKNSFPFCYDFAYSFDGGNYTVGTSGYSTFGDATPNVAINGGSPKSGVLNWMAKDKFTVFGVYGEAKVNNLTLQGEYWTSAHKAVRDTAKVKTVVTSAGISSIQRERFLINPAAPGAVKGTNVRTNASYVIQTWYLRAGYSFETGIGEIAPYLQWDWYKNPETIANKTYGGDDEAGVADDGIFNKSTVGVIYRPTSEVAVKFDQSFHFYKFNGENVRYPEIRLDFSFTFGI
ncbi:MAG TPA: hypothetical protein DGH68_01840 [Bacteroidetes bacterium]|nr:hypothetical protein [Bacteroidota bacterium]